MNSGRIWWSSCFTSNSQIFKGPGEVEGGVDLGEAEKEMSYGLVIQES
jgi:hypothetical protein